MTNAVFDTLSLRQKELAKYVYLTATILVARSALLKWAHRIERTGLALLGGSCGLYVAALIGKTNVVLGSDWIMLLIVLYGAFGAYVGIDLPNRPAKRVALRLLEESSASEAGELFSAAGTFVAAAAGFLSISIIVLDQAVPNGLTVVVGCCWTIGTSLQIAAARIANGHNKDGASL